MSICQKSSGGETLCGHCCKVSWANPENVSAFTRPLRRVSISSLKSSSCPVCRLIGEFRSMTRSLDNASFGLLRERQHKCIAEPGTSHEAVSVLRQGSDPDYFFRPHILMSRLDHSNTTVRLKSIFPQKLDHDLLKSWLDDCKLNHHQRCRPHRRPPLQRLKVIDCHDRKVVDALPGLAFFALSYVWGDSSSEAVECYDALESRQLMPQTISQSIQLTLNLGCRFLWVDRYCIPQHDPAAKQLQISQMGDIYLAADLTIVASTGTDPSSGLPGLSPTLRRPVHHVEVKGNHLYAIPHIAGSRDILDSRWATRGWTFQEGFLSRRRLVFTDRQAIFVCDTETYYEATTIPMLHGYKSVEDREASYLREELLLENCLPRRQLETKWADTGIKSSGMDRARAYLEQYCRRSLRFDNDALEAISGALYTLASESVYHISGLPFDFHTDKNDRYIELSMHWSHLNRGKTRRRNGFPSWSPIGWEGRISWDSRASALPARFNEIHVVVEQKGTSLWDFDASPDLRAHVTNEEQLAFELPTTRLTVLRQYGSGKPSEEHVIALRYDEYTYIYLGTYWSISDTQLANTAYLTGVLFSSHLKSYTSWVMVLRQRGAYYERIGVARFCDHYNAGQLDYCVHDWEGREFRLKNWQSLGHGQGEWWLKLFKTEAIVLG
ncbi:HET-domain-containing protein [Didymella exigua CBS 183.55]|uniref:HET-domain-containing protein n=1 Tax=Didymella exigua CBS 183.55 TaxID=1150837 RepID=A0A6A5RJ92_9PLEO|nr:HET-domain-containing protein [Didymella exigua CBS 183.55]KAF1927882.1 HET-domain-containing protein [Didymella exigua CBS 183.55]